MPIKNYRPKPKGNVSAVRMSGYSNMGDLTRLLSMCSAVYSVTYRGDVLSCCELKREGGKSQTVLWSDYVMLDEGGTSLIVLGSKEFLAMYEEDKVIVL